MASLYSTRFVQILRPAVPGRFSSLQTLRFFSSSAADAASPALPPLLANLRTDLKAAMRAKDAPRLSVLRTVLTAFNNAAKTSSPIVTNAQLVVLLRKTQRAGQDAAAQFRAAGRDDLADKEDLQAKVIAEYIANSGVRTITEAEFRVLVDKTIEECKSAGKSGLGEVMKRLNAATHDKDTEFDKKRMTELVKEVLKL